MCCSRRGGRRSPTAASACAIVGAGELEDALRARAATLAGVELTGQVARDRGLEILAAARALVVPSRWYEVFPRIVAEAYALGVPVIASRLGSLAEIVADGETGLHSEPGDAADLARALRRLADDRDLVERLGAGARGEYVRNLSPRRTTDRLLEIYSGAHGTTGRSRGGAARRGGAAVSVVAERRTAPTQSRAGRRARGSGTVHLVVVSRRSSSSARSTSTRRPTLARASPSETAQITNYGPSWWDQQKFGPVTPGDLAVFVFAYIGVVTRLGKGRLQISERTAWLLGLVDDRRPDRYRGGRLQRDAEPVRRLAPPGCSGVLFAFALWSTIFDRPGLLALAQIYVAIMRAIRHRPADRSTHRAAARSPSTAGRPSATTPRSSSWWPRSGVDGDATHATARRPCGGRASRRHGGRGAAFRRYAWVELATVFTAFVLLSGVNRRRYIVSIAAVAVACLVTIALTWSSLDWGGRFASLDPTQTERTTSTRPPTRATSTTSSTASTRSRRTRSPASAWASSTTRSARPAGRATPGWCTTPRSRSGSSSGSWA